MKTIIGAFMLSVGIAMAQTNYTDSDVSFSLPTGWKQSTQSTPDLLVFRDPTGNIQLTVSLMTYNATNLTAALAQRIFDHRLDAEKKTLAPGEPLEISPIQETNGVYRTDFKGMDTKHARCFAGMLVIARGRIVVGYLEGLRTTPAVLDLARQVVFPTLKIP
jgi:hypothetical protein